MITKQSIAADLEAFQQRKDSAINLLLGLPASATTSQVNKKLKQQRRHLETEISHVSGLIDLAQRSLDGEWD
jgi:hypothetical protein